MALLPLSMYATSATIGNGQLNVHLYRYRNSDLWLVIGTTAIVARLWTYHRLYDDILILLPMISLFRIASTNRFPSRANLIPVALLTIGWIAALAPARLLNSPPPLSLLFKTGQVLIWLSMLAFLIGYAWKQKKASNAVVDRPVTFNRMQA